MDQASRNLIQAKIERHAVQMPHTCWEQGKSKCYAKRVLKASKTKVESDAFSLLFLIYCLQVMQEARCDKSSKGC